MKKHPIKEAKADTKKIYTADQLGTCDEFH